MSGRGRQPKVEKRHAKGRTMARAKGRFAGKVVLITGASGGQGRVQAAMFAGEGATVVLTDIAAGAGKAACAGITAKGARASFMKLDVVAAESWAQALRRIRRVHGRLDVLVNNAGVVSRTSVRTIPMTEWERLLAINLTGPMLGIQAAAPLMRDSGGGSGGRQRTGERAAPVGPRTIRAATGFSRKPCGG